MEDNTEAAAWGLSYVIGSATKAETGGRAVFTLPASTAGTHEAGYKTSLPYDITGDGFYININQMVATGVAAYAQFLLWLSTGNYVRWVQQSNTIKAQKVLAGVVTDLYSATWSGTTYKYLRIRESAGTTYFDSSTNGTAWTNRASLANPFAVTDLYPWIAAGVVGSVASPGAFRVEDVNLILPALTTNWRWTQIVWPLANRYKVVTLALDTVATAQGYVVTADGIDVNGDPSGNVRYWSGVASGGRELTEQATDAAAKAMAVNIPVDGRFDLPAIVEARVIRVYHRSIDGSAYTLREVYPRRLVQADDIEAEAIRAINIAASAVTVDKLDATLTITGKNIQTDYSGARVVLSGDAFGGMIGYGATDTYSTTAGTGTYQIFWDMTDGKLYAGSGNVVLDVNGITLGTGTNTAWNSTATPGSSEVGIDYNGTTWLLSATSKNLTIATSGSGHDITLSTESGSVVRVNAPLKVQETIQPSNVAVSYSANYNASLANNGVMAIGLTDQTNQAIIMVQAGSAAAIYALFGAAHTVLEMSDPGGFYTGTAGSASSINIYWSAGNSRYELENKRGSAISVRVWIHEAA